MESININRLRPTKSNPRVHSDRQINLIKRSIQRFGFNNPILVDSENNIIAGHGRAKAAQQLGMNTVPVLRIEHLNPDEIRAYIIADNRLAEKSGWDRALLAIELQGLSEIGFEIDSIGFEPAELDIVLEEAAEASSMNETCDVIPATEKLLVSKPGCLWICGNHRVFCGDARDEQHYERVLDGDKASFVFTDPPYNVKIVGHVSSRGHDNFAMASGEMSPEEFSAFLESVFRLMSAYSSDGSLHQVCMDWRHIGEIITAGKKVFHELKNICVWCKTNAGMGSLCRSQHELILVWLNGTGTHVNNVELGRHGRSRSNVWTYPGVNTFRRGRNDELRMHPTVKPVDLVADAIKDCSLRGAIVLDPFLGSGTSLIAAEKTGRKARGLEIDPRYVDVAEEFFTPDKNCYVEPKKSIPRRRPRAKQDVGYRRPPIESRWKPGQSGNPSGRPKGSKNLRSAIEEMLTEKITVTEGNKIRRVTRLEAVLLKQLSLALKGDLKAIQAVYTSANTLGMLEVRPDKIVVRNLSPLTDDELLELERLLVKAGGGIEPG